MLVTSVIAGTAVAADGDAANTAETQAQPQTTARTVDKTVKSSDAAAQDDGSVVYSVDVPVADGDGASAGSVMVDVTAPAGALPDGVSLEAAPVSDLDAVASQLADADVDYAGLLALDVRFSDADGNEVEPSVPVSVSFETPQSVLGDGVDASSVMVRHFVEDETGKVTKVETVADAGGESDGTVSVGDGVQAMSADTGESDAVVTAGFTVDSFSSFTITWSAYNGYWTDSVTVHHVDESGGDIGSRTPDVTVDADAWVTLSEYAQSISGYSFKEARLNSWKSSGYDAGTVATQIKWRANNGGQWRYRNEGSGSDSSWNSYRPSRDVYLIYEKTGSSNPGGDQGGTSSGAKVTTGKTVTVRDDGNYDLNLSFTGDQGSKDNPAKVDILLVVDKSGSMAYDLDKENGDSRERMQAVVDAVDGLTDTLEANDRADVRYDLVTFSSLGYTSSDRNTGWTTDAQSVDDAVSRFTEKRRASFRYPLAGGTNYQYAISEAKDALNNRSVRSDAQQIVVFLTDGIPTHRGLAGRYETRDDDNKDYANTTAAVDELSGLNADAFYAIGIGPSFTSTSSTDEPTNGRTNLGKIIQGAKNEGIANSQLYTTESSGELEKIFQQIAGSVTFFAADHVTATDPLSGNVEMVTGEDGQPQFTITVTGPNNKSWSNPTPVGPDGTLTFKDSKGDAVTATVTYDAESRTITLSLPETYQLEKGYTYAVQTVIRPTDAVKAAGPDGYDGTADADTGTYAGKRGYFTNDNDNAKVSYDAIVTDEDGTVTSRTPGSVNFPKPVVQVPDVPDVPSADDTKVTTGKSAVLGDDGNYTLNLSVSGDRGRKDEKQAVDVLFILDESNSMSEKWGTNTAGWWDDNRPTRIESAKDAIGQIIGAGGHNNGLSQNESLNVNYALVGFYGGEDDEGHDNTFNDAAKLCDWTANANDLYGAAPGSLDDRSYGGTNYEAGFKKANEIGWSRDNALHVVIFISDGNPGYYYVDGKTEGTRNPADNYDETALSQAETELGKLNSDYFYFVGVTSSLSSDVFTGIVDASPAPAANKDSYSANDSEDLLEAFADIQQKLTFVQAKNVSMVDPLSKWSQLVPDTGSDPATYTFTLQLEKRNDVGSDYAKVGESRKVTINAGGTSEWVTLTDGTESVPMQVSLSENGKTITVEFADDYKLAQNYRYTVSTTITTTDAAKNEPADSENANQTPDEGTGTHADKDETGFWSNDNDNAVVHFTPVATDQDNHETEGEPSTEPFPKPVIQVQEAEFDYPSDAHLALRKSLPGGVLDEDNQFTFKLTDKTEYSDTESDEVARFGVDGHPCTGEGCTVTNEASGESIADVTDFGDVVFPAHRSYLFRIQEVEDGDHPDVVFDKHVLYVLYVIGDDGSMTRYIHIAANAEAPVPATDPDATGSDGTKVWTFAGTVPADDSEPTPGEVTDADLTWTNVLKVSSLPLTGGDATARTIVLAGGGVLLLAGAAWLLARRRRV